MGRLYRITTLVYIYFYKNVYGFGLGVSLSKISAKQLWPPVQPSTCSHPKSAGSISFLGNKTIGLRRFRACPDWDSNLRLRLFLARKRTR